MKQAPRQLRRAKVPWKRVEAAVRRRPWLKRERCLVDALRRCYHGQARIYAGDLKLAEIAKCCGISIWRAKRDLERLHVLAVIHTRGGYTRNPQGELVRAATGYEPHPELYQQEPAPRPRPAPAKPAPRSSEDLKAWSERTGIPLPDS